MKPISANSLLGMVLLGAVAAGADQAGRAYPENSLHAQPAVQVTVGHSHADILGSDNFVRGNTIVGNARGGVFWRAESGPMAARRVTFEKKSSRVTHSEALSKWLHTGQLSSFYK